MLWEIEIQSLQENPELARVRDDYNLLSHSNDGQTLLTGATKGYLIEGDLDESTVQQLLHKLILDPIVEKAQLTNLSNGHSNTAGTTVLLKPGVMDPVAQSVVEASRDLGIEVKSTRTFRRYLLDEGVSDTQRQLLTRKVLCNDAIEQIIDGPLHMDHLTLGSPYHFEKKIIPILKADDESLMQISREGQLSLTLDEMQTIQAHFQQLNREPTDAELESIAQTWSEHCSHKTLKGRIDFGDRKYQNLLKETIFGATQQIRERAGNDDWCVSVFEDNAGVVTFDDNYHVCFKVETHNRPSAIEPYGGASTGIGGVIRDPLGTGLGAKPICNTDVFCFAPPDTDPDTLPSGVLHPRSVMKGVVAGVRDYGNRMGIPTVNGAVCFDERFLGNPLVYCGTVGIIPVGAESKQPLDGDLIIAVGGRTGRDGIHGATFSSAELTSESEVISGGAVQIGNAITEKKLMDIILQARDQGLYNAITDCGAGGFSSAVGEMGAELGAEVHLEKAPLKYEGLSYTEIWISEAQERMILSVSPEHWPTLKSLCESEDVEATEIGQFKSTGKLQLFYEGNLVADLEMDFLHDGRPDLERKAEWQRPQTQASALSTSIDIRETLLQILSSWNVCSKEVIIRQYDHEVQANSVIKPLVGIEHDGPGDASVVMPVLGSWRGIAVGCGLNPHYGDLDPYRMAASAIDEAVRNVVAVGADPSRIALLDNFCWGNTDRPEVLGSLVLASEACRDLAIAYNMPFISGKDSLKNEFHSADMHIVIPPTLLISAMGQVPDVRQCVTMDLKEAGNELYLIGETKHELAGSHVHLVHQANGGDVPTVNVEQAPKVFHALHQAIRAGLIRSCHDLSEGGLAVAIAEMAFAGGVGVELDQFEGDSLIQQLFSESNTRFVVEVKPENVASLQAQFEGLPLTKIGHTNNSSTLQILEHSWTLSEIKDAWQQPLRW